MHSVLIWSYHPETGKLIGSDRARESPLEPGKYLVPAFATTQAPPEAEEGKDVVFTADGWVLVEKAPKQQDSNAQAMAELFSIDIASIRAIREHILYGAGLGALEDLDSRAIKLRGALRGSD